jgi:hypothetical protein
MAHGDFSRFDSSDGTACHICDSVSNSSWADQDFTVSKLGHDANDLL